MGDWTAISESEYPWEREALEFIRKGLPSSSPIQAWSNFEFMAEGGAIYEVDLLVVGPWGAFLVEIKSRPGVISSQGGSWTWRDGTGYKTKDNPLPLTNRKAKALKSLLERQKAFGKEKVPFIEPLVFCSHEGNVLDLHGPARNGVCLRDKAGSPVPGILGAIARREAPGLRSYPRPPVTKEQIRAFCRGVEQVSLRPVQKARRAGDYVLAKLYHDSPMGTYQEWFGHHVRTKSVPRLIRVYLEGLQGETERAILKRAAEREFQILERIEHPGILRIDTLTETETGPALVFRWQEGAQRLDHYLADQTQPLPAHVSLGILRQITEAIAYAHRRKVIHRGLSPQSIIVLPHGPNEEPVVQIYNWQLGLLDSGTSGGGTRTRLSLSLHAGQFVEDEATVFFAPEAVAGQNIDGEELDSFSLGALAYYLFSGQPPADSLLDLDDKLRKKGHLDLCAVRNGVVPKLAELIDFTARADRELRLSAEDILGYLSEIWEEMTAPDPAEVVDPRSAKAGELLEHGYRVVRDLGTGSCSKVLLVETSDGERQVLKVAAKQDYSARLKREFETIRKIRHPNVIRVFKCHQFDGVTGFTMEPAFSRKKATHTDDRESSLARRLKEDGPLDLDMLQRFGEELLQTIDELERLGISHRDIKPDNLGIRSVQKGPLQLVLFDFSLSNSPAEDIRLGTPPYLDPFLPLRKVPRWDHHAERFGAAMTLHEMASNTLPVWGDGGSVPHLVEASVTLRPELFPEPLRERLVDFFRKALAREVRDRFDNTQDMVLAWRRCFEKIDQPAVAPSTEADASADVPTRAEILASATPRMQLVLLGLSVRLMNVLERLELVTVADLLAYPIGRIRRLRGVGYKTSQEVLDLYQQLRERFPDIEAAERVTEAAKDASTEPEHSSVDLIARQLVVSASGKADGAEREILDQFLGWKTPADDPTGFRWPSQTELAATAGIGVTRARVGQVITKGREKWAKNTSLTRLRASIHATLLSQGGVTTHAELIRLVLLLRGSTLSEPDSLRMASIATRAAVEAERQMQAPRFLEFRRQGILFLAVDQAYVEFARQLGAAGEDLASRDPLPTAARVLETLSAIPFPQTEIDDLRPPDQARRAHLAAAVSGNVCVNGRLELYPRNLPAERALALSRSALFGARELTLDDIRGRVASRYPAAEPLPGRPALDELLEQVGFPLRWEATAAQGKGAYQSKHAGTGASTSFTPGSRFPTIDLRPMVGEPVSDEIAEALRLEDKLAWSRKQGSFLVLAADPRLLRPAADALARLGLEELSASALILAAMKEQAAALGVAWDVVLDADAAPKNDKRWTRLQELVRRSLPGVLKTLRTPGRNLLLTDSGLFARYGRMNELDALRNDTGTRSGPHGLWLLIPGHGAQSTPTLCGQAVPITSGAQFETLTPEWIRNEHRGGKS